MKLFQLKLYLQLNSRSKSYLTLDSDLEVGYCPQPFLLQFHCPLLSQDHFHQPLNPLPRFSRPLNSLLHSYPSLASDLGESHRPQNFLDQIELD